MTAISPAAFRSPVNPGEIFAGKYRIQRVIGSGGHGVVLAAHHPQLGQTVAIKLLNTPVGTESVVAKRFLREARAAASLHSQHVARVMDAGTDDCGRQYMVMEYLSGHDLRALYRLEGLAPPGDTIGYILHACEALAEAHAAGIIHRDLKPENLFLTKGADGSPLIKVLDFGVSKTRPAGQQADLYSSVLTNDQDILGSPPYMSPEQLKSPETVDLRTDVWSLGIILYELMTGRRPFSSDPLADLRAGILPLPPKPPSTVRDDIPEELDAIVLRCFAKNPSDRFQNVGELAKELHPWAPRWAREAAVSAARTAGVMLPKPGAGDVPVKVSRRRKALAAVGVAVIGLVLFLAFRPSPPATTPEARRALSTLPTATLPAPPPAEPVAPAVVPERPTPPRARARSDGMGRKTGRAVKRAPGRNGATGRDPLTGRR